MRISDWSSDVCSSDLLLDDARSFDFSQVQLAFLSDADPELTAQAERAADAGVIVFDASGQAWRDSAIPVVVPQVNAKALSHYRERYIVASPDRFNVRSEEHTSELQSLMRISYAVFCLKKKKTKNSTLQQYITLK